MSKGDVPSQKRRKIAIFKVNSHNLVHSSYLPGAPTQSQAPYLCKKKKKKKKKKGARARRVRPPLNQPLPPCMLFFIQTSRILCAGAISRVSFFDLFGPIAGAIDSII